jgi:MFS transporter, DHA3 family, macrolide efflux protein
MTTAKNQGFRANLELFKNRDFAILWAGNTFSGLGDSIYFIARIALIIHLTGSALAAGGMTVFGILPTILMSLTGGALADRFNRQRLVIWSNLARGILMVILAWLIYVGLVQFWHLYVVAFINNSFYAISNPAFEAMLPSVVKSEQLTQAYSAFSIGTNFAQIAGPALAALLVVISGTQGAMFFNGLSFLVMMFALMLIHPHVSAVSTRKKSSQMWNDVKEGWYFVRQNNALVTYFISMAFINFLLPSIILGVPFFITRVLKLDIGWYGAVAVGFNFGTILGSLIASVWMIKRRGILLILCNVLMGGFIFLTFGFGYSIWFVVIGMIIIYINISLYNVISLTWVQQTTTDEFRGRVFGILSMISYSLTPLGYAVMGFLLDRFDAKIIIPVSGLGIVMVGLWMYSKKDMRGLR